MEGVISYSFSVSRTARLKDKSLEDSANFPLHCHPEFPASLDTLKVSVPPAVKVAAATADLDIIAAEWSEWDERPAFANTTARQA